MSTKTQLVGELKYLDSSNHGLVSRLLGFLHQVNVGPAAPLYIMCLERLHISSCFERSYVFNGIETILGVEVL